MTKTKARAGNFFEDFAVGQVLTHATPRTLTAGDVALYNALYGPRFAVQSSDAFAQAIGYRQAPVDDLLVFHIVFGKTVPDISLNAVANLGYAEGRFLAAVYPGDTLTATSELIGLRETSNRTSGVVYVRTTGRNQRGEPVLEYARWVMVRKRDAASPAPAAVMPKLAERVDPAALGAAVPALDVGRYDFALTSSYSRLCSRAMPVLIAIHIATRPRTANANSRAPKPSPRRPMATSPAERVSPKRTKNMSIAAFALYFASRLVGKNSTCLSVFCSE